MWGFVPTRRDTFVSAKVPKTIFACARPSGKLRYETKLYGCATRSAQTVLAKESNLVPQRIRPQRIERTKNSMRSNSPRGRGRFGVTAQPRSTHETQGTAHISNDRGPLVLREPAVFSSGSLRFRPTHGTDQTFNALRQPSPKSRFGAAAPPQPTHLPKGYFPTMA